VRAEAGRAGRIRRGQRPTGGLRRCRRCRAGGGRRAAAMSDAPTGACTEGTHLLFVTDVEPRRSQSVILPPTHVPSPLPSPMQPGVCCGRSGGWAEMWSRSVGWAAKQWQWLTVRRPSGHPPALSVCTMPQWWCRTPVRTRSAEPCTTKGDPSCAFSIFSLTIPCRRYTSV